MPIEIKELHIKVAINQSEGTTTPANETITGSNGMGNKKAHQDDLIAACVEQVLQILQEKREA